MSSARAGRFTRKKAVLCLFAGFILLMLGVVACDVWIRRCAAGRHFADTALLPNCPAALVLGCSPKVADGRENLFFRYRIEAAAQLYQQKKVRHLIVSGDNAHRSYDEPTAMREALVKEGVPAQAIQADYAGFRTLDSVLRAERVFDQKRFIIVSQRFHNERALFIAHHHGLEAFGFDAQDVPVQNSVYTRCREFLARVKAVLDVKLLGTAPKFDGPKVPLAP
jgi:SanA protein